MFNLIKYIMIDTSLLIFSGIIVCGLASLPIILKGLHKLVKDFFKYKEEQKINQQNQKIEEYKSDLKIVINSGSLTELIDTANKLGDTKK